MCGLHAAPVVTASLDNAVVELISKTLSKISFFSPVELKFNVLKQLFTVCFTSALLFSAGKRERRPSLTTAPW